MAASARLTSRQRITARKHRPDYGIVLLTGLLTLTGLVVLFSIGPALEVTAGVTVGKQFISILIGVIGFIAAAFIPISFWHRAQPVLILLAAIASLLLLLPGGTINPEINGAQRWLILGPFSFQPAELLKFALIIYLATFLAQRVKQETLNDVHKTLLPLGIVFSILAIFVVIFQRDLGTMLVVVGILVSMLFVSGIRLRQMALVGGGVMAAGILAILLAPHRLSRLTTFLDPKSDLEGAGYHINQALIAVGSGGIFGLGLGNSVQAYGYLPEAGTDSIFAVYAEKFGFVGSVVILVLFGLLLIRIVRVIEHAPNTYMRLLATGTFAWLFCHIVINIGAMLSIFPLTGITLPFLSIGGSSLLFIMMALGLLFNISRYTSFELPERRANGTDSSRRRRNRRARYAH